MPAEPPADNPDNRGPLRLFNSLTRRLETFAPVHPGVPGDPAQPPEARVYSCGPTVYNYPHIGNMRAYVFADVLGRTLSWKGYELTHVINITDVGHLTDDADAGEDKLEKAARERARSIWDIARHYTEAFKADIAALNIRGPMKGGKPEPAHWSIATDYVARMIEFAKGIAEKHCYELPGGLYFDVATVSDYGRLAGHPGEQGEGRIEAVEGKRHAADFAIWRKTAPGERRQMEWDSPWGRGAPGWHLECSVMSQALLGFPFDIHTGGIDHREIHHPNEIAQNQAFCGCADTGARLWLHNNFLVERRSGEGGGKMSKSAGEFLRLPLLIEKGYHPLAYRLMCLQAHYRSELEFSWEGLAAALTRLKRLVMAALPLKEGGDGATKHPKLAPLVERFDAAISDDLNTPVALTVLEEALALRRVDLATKRAVVEQMDGVLGLKLLELSRADLRLRPWDAALSEEHVIASIALRNEARALQNFAVADRLRTELAAQGVEVMDGDPLGWEWKLG